MNKVDEIKYILEDFPRDHTDNKCVGVRRDYVLYKAKQFLIEYRELLSQKSSQEFVKED